MQFPHIIFSEAIDRAIGWTVLHAIWQITLIAFLTGIVLILLRSKPSNTRYWVANLALWSTLCTSVATFGWYLQTPAPAAQEFRMTPQTPVAENTAQASPLSNSVVLPANQPVIHTEEGVNATIFSKFSEYFNQNLPMVVLLWFAGLALSLLKLLGGLLQVFDLKRRMNFPADPYWSEMLDKLVQRSGFPQGIALLESALVRSPLTIGHIKPVILFPIGVINRLSEQEVEAILAHELAHILRRDYLFNIIQRFIESLYYFHPAIWWISAQVRNEREHACDDQAIALLNNKVNYAKALVAIQEMAFFPQTAALAFAGTGKSQLMRRVQRLFTPAKTGVNLMERGITAALVGGLVVVLAFGQSFQSIGNQTDKQTINTPAPFKNTGVWEAEFYTKDSIRVSLSTNEAGNNWNHSSEYPKSAFTNLTDANGDMSFLLERPAGKIAFTGKKEGTNAYGRFTFTPDDAFRKNLEQQGMKDVDDVVLLQCFFANFPVSYLSDIKKLGFDHIDKDELIQLAVFGLTVDAIKSNQELAATLGKKQLSVEELIQMRIFDATPAKIKRLVETGYDHLSWDDATQMSLHNIDPEYVKSMNKAGFGQLSTEQLLAAKIQDIDPAYIQEVQQLGLGKLDFDDIISLKVQNINAEVVKEMQQLNLGKLNLEEVINLKIHNISPEFIEQCKQMNLGELSVEKLIQMRIFEITPEFMKQFDSFKFQKMTLEDLVAAKIHGLTPDFIKLANEKGYKFPTLGEYAQLKIMNSLNK